MPKIISSLKACIFFKELKGRLMVALTLIALLSILGFGLAAYLSERGALMENLRADLTSTADFKKMQIIDWLNQCIADVRMVAINKSNRDNLSKLMGVEDGLSLHQAQNKETPLDPRAMTMMTAMLTNNLLSLQQSRVGYARIVVADKTGRIRITTDAMLYGQSMATDVAFLGTLHAKNGAYIQDIHRDPKDPSGPYWMNVGYIINPDLSIDNPDPAKTIGIVLITINVNETLFPLLRSWHMGNTGEIFLHNAQNDITFAVGPEQSHLADSSIFTVIESAPAQFIDDEAESMLETVDDKGTPILAAYRHIAQEEGPRLDWKLVVKKDLREIYAPLYKLLTHIALIAIALLGVTTLASVLIARTLSQPLAELVRVMQSVALGNLKTKIDFTRNDEIGQLATAFQEMIRALEKHQLELEDA
ncbi:MAG: HAMP domain-containing protein, partial [Chloroflexi bacterium]|nr:HAMP domain-containing protein [Chloroflexota bacterium]